MTEILSQRQELNVSRQCCLVVIIDRTLRWDLLGHAISSKQRVKFQDFFCLIGLVWTHLNKYQARGISLVVSLNQSDFLCLSQVRQAATRTNCSKQIQESGNLCRLFNVHCQQPFHNYFNIFIKNMSFSILTSIDRLLLDFKRNIDLNSMKVQLPCPSLCLRKHFE